jgi:hypothetical protein
MGEGRRGGGDEVPRPYGWPFLVVLGLAGAGIAVALTPLFPADGLAGRLPFVIGVVAACSIALAADAWGRRRRGRR